MTRRNPRRKQTIINTFSDHVQSTHGFIADMRLANETLNSARNTIDEGVIHDRQFRAVDRCLADIELYHPDDPNQVAARYQLLFVTSWPYRLWRKLIAGLNWTMRLIGRELVYAGIIPLQLILIVIFNVAAFLLVWWILFSF